MLRLINRCLAAGFLFIAAGVAPIFAGHTAGPQPAGEVSRSEPPPPHFRSLELPEFLRELAAGGKVASAWVIEEEGRPERWIHKIHVVRDGWGYDLEVFVENDELVIRCPVGQLIDPEYKRIPADRLLEIYKKYGTAGGLEIEHRGAEKNHNVCVQLTLDNRKLTDEDFVRKLDETVYPAVRETHALVQSAKQQTGGESR